MLQWSTDNINKNKQLRRNRWSTNDGIKNNRYDIVIVTVYVPTDDVAEVLIKDQFNETLPQVLII